MTDGVQIILYQFGRENKIDSEHTTYLVEAEQAYAADLGKLKNGSMSSVVIVSHGNGDYFWRATPGLEIDRHEEPDTSGITSEETTDDYLVFYNPCAKRELSVSEIGLDSRISKEK